MSCPPRDLQGEETVACADGSIALIYRVRQTSVARFLASLQKHILQPATGTSERQLTKKIVFKMPKRLIGPQSKIFHKRTTS